MARGGGLRGGHQGGNPSVDQRSTPRRSARVDNLGSSLGVRGTDVTLCGMCSCRNMPIGTDAMGCDQCSLWVHLQCTNLPATAIQCCSSITSGAGVNDNPNLPREMSISQLFPEAVANLANQSHISLITGSLGQNPRTSHSSPAITREFFFLR